MPVPSLAIRIHRGAHEIGGTCIEVRADGHRLVLDAGMPMSGPRRGCELLPDVPGLWAEGDGSLQALVISHPHQDHYGLADLVDPSVPVYLGARAQAVLRASALFSPWAPQLRVDGAIAHREPIELGPFTVTPWLMDHSAEDAYALLVEAGGRRVLYTGDWRGHGSNPATVDELAADVGPLDTVLIEGTRIDRSDTDSTSLPTESAVEDALADLFATAPRTVLAFCSAQNLDRMDRIREACRRSGRTMVMDFYAAALWEAAAREPLREARGQLRVWLPHQQRQRVIEAAAFDRLDAVRDQRIHREELLDRAGEVVIVCRTSALSELETLGVLLGADAAWSMWRGYLDHPSMEPSRRILRRNGVLVHSIHTSGHASAADICGLVRRLDARQVVPIHTAAPEVCAALLPGAVLKGDGEWWPA